MGNFIRDKWSMLRSVHVVWFQLGFYLSQLIGWKEFSLVVASAPCRHLHWIPARPFVVIRKAQSQLCEQSFKAYSLIDFF